MSKFFKAYNAIKSIKTNVPKTKLDKKKSELAIAIQKTKGSKAKLNQTLFEIKNKQPLTFKSEKGIKTKSNTELKKEKKAEKQEKFKKTMDDNKKAITRIFNAPKNFNKGGRVGRKLGGGPDMAKRKTNVEKIKETFAPKKKNLSPKQMKIAKLAGNPNKIDGADFKKLRNR